jgi:AcrR family transcriptional regulator
MNFTKTDFKVAASVALSTEAGTTKGALFHHFKGKNDLGYAVVREIIYPQLKDEWT